MVLEYKNKKIDEIKPDKNQPRRSIDKDKIEEMAKSIKTEGVINAVEIDKNNIIVTGETRWRAAKLLGLEKIPCKIIDIEGRDRYRRQVIENICNNTMNPIDTAKAISKLLEKHVASSPGKLARDKFHKSNRYQKGVVDLAEELGKPKSFITEHLELLKLTEPIQKKIENGMARTINRAISKIPEKEKKKFEKKIEKDEFSSRDSAIRVASAIQNNPDKAKELLKENYKGKSDIEIQNFLKDKVGEPISAVSKIEEGENLIDNIELLLIKINEWLSKNERQDIPQFFLEYLDKALILTLTNIKGWLEGKETKVLKKSYSKIIEGEDIK